MNVVELAIYDTYGTRDVRFAPGSVTYIRGRNGSGKSSIIKSLLYLFDGGSDFGVIRRGAKKSIVELRLGNGVRIVKTTTASGARLEVTDVNGLVVASPQKYIQGLADSLSVNPGRLLRLDASTAAGRKALTTALLETMPVEFAPADFEAVASRATLAGGGICSADQAALDLIGKSLPPGKVDLDALARYRKQIEESRRAVGVQAKEADQGANALVASIPSTQDATGAEVRMAEIDITLAAIKEAAHVERTAALRDEERERAALREKFDAGLAALREKRDAATALVQHQEAEASLLLKQEAAGLAEKVDVARKAKGARGMIESLRGRYREHQGKYDLFTLVLELLDAARKAKLANLPIDGVTLGDDGPLVDGVRWQDVNTARLVEVAVQHACLRPGQLNLIVEDDAEHLDSETEKLLIDALTEAGHQVILAEVRDDTPLTIETVKPKAGTISRPGQCAFCEEGVPAADCQHQTVAGEVECLNR